MAAPAPAPVPAPAIDVQNPTPADIQAAIARVPVSKSSAGYWFYSTPRAADGTSDPNGVIDQQYILATLKNMFAQNGPLDANGQPQNLPWNGCLQQPNLILALRAIGAFEPPLDPIINIGQTNGYLNADIKGMKSRIVGVKNTLTKTLNAINAERAAAVAAGQIANPIAQAAAAAGAQAVAIGAQAQQVQAAAQADLQAQYDRGYADGEAAAQAAADGNGMYFFCFKL